MIEAIKIISFIWILFLLLQLLSKLTSYNYIERLSKFTRSLFENHWVLLREYAKKNRKRNSNIAQPQNCYENAYRQPNEISVTKQYQ